jgi:hypothetical protein
MEEHLEDEHHEPSVKGVAFKWGIILGLVSFVWFIILAITEQQSNAALSMIGFIFLIGGIILAMREYKSLRNSFLSFKQGLGLGVLTTLVSSIVSGILTFVYMSFIDTTYMERVIEAQRAEMSKTMDPAQVDAAMEMSAAFISPGATLIMGIVISVFVGFIISLIVAAIMKNERPEEVDF